mmetsp:Transcript_64232/g.182403  ORF Transcript_64232/g.182403 Transcript_64232/m.182403 type:complete len:330 (+) Transcript_64232:56-1045(+)
MLCRTNGMVPATEGPQFASAPSDAAAEHLDAAGDPRWKKAAKWWRRIDGDCPISLTPICELSAPPFALEAVGSSRPHYFDAQLLAGFLLSSADFIDPVNRQPLAREQCVALDAHLRRHLPCRPVASVADAFDLFTSHCGNGDPAQRQAAAVLQHLFSFTDPRAAGAPARERGAVAAAAPPSFGAGEFPALALAAAASGSGAVVARAARSPRAARGRQHRRAAGLGHGGFLHPLQQASVCDDLAEQSVPELVPGVRDHTDPPDVAAALSEGDDEGSESAEELLHPLHEETGDETGSHASAEDAERNRVIEDELEVLKSIYGEDAVFSTGR